jgi:hypothetical protein
MPATMQANYKILFKTIILRLLNRSAKIPELAEKRRNGSTKIAPVVAKILWLFSIPSNWIKK